MLLRDGRANIRTAVVACCEDEEVDQLVDARLALLDDLALGREWHGSNITPRLRSIRAQRRGPLEELCVLARAENVEALYIRVRAEPVRPPAPVPHHEGPQAEDRRVSAFGCDDADANSTDGDGNDEGSTHRDAREP